VRITRDASAPIVGTRTWAEMWEGEDLGTIACWSRGREKAREDPDLAALAVAGELVVLPWKGGVERAIKAGHKFGTLYYLAMWQGLRGDALDIELEEETTLTCSKTGMKITYTPAQHKYAEA